MSGRFTGLLGRIPGRRGGARVRGGATPARPARGLRGAGRALLRWAGLLLALTAALIFLFFYSAAFVVKDLSVEGVKGDVATSVEQLADIPHGRPLARVSESRVKERVLTDPRVADVTVEKSWPSTVTLHATVRKPALVLRQGSKSWLADEQGVVFDQASKVSNKLPVVTVPEPPAEMSPDAVRGLVELWRLRPDPAQLEGELGAPTLDKKGAVSMQVGQLTIEWGTPTEAEKKWKVVSALVGQESINPAGGIPQTIDVSLPDSPVVSGLPEATG